MSALNDVRVVDLSVGIAGPVATMFMADFGADVVKVEQPGGDPARADPGFPTWNRNKRGIVVDPVDTEHRQRLSDLVRGADVLVVNDASASAGRGLDVEAATRDNPGLVVLEVPPFAGPTPWYGGKESQGLLAAFTGPALRQSSWDGGPIETIPPQLLYIQGVWGATCALAALIERNVSGYGQLVTVSGVHAMMEACTGSITLDPSDPPAPTTNGPGGPSPVYSRYRCGDDRWVFVAALTPKFQARLLKCLGIEDMLDDERLAGALERMLLPDNRGWVRKRVEQIFASGSRDEWMAKLSEAGVPAGPLLVREDWLDHEQVKAIGMRAEVDDPERGRVVMPGVPTVLTGSPGSVRTSAPGLGEHDAEVRSWTPRPRPEGAPPTQEPPAGPLRGMRVLDLGAILAGPYAGHLLAELGADVIKVEPPTGDSFRVRGFTYNRGMRGLAIDLRDERGQNALYAMAARSDVVIDNYRPGVLADLKITYDRLSAVNDKIVTLSISGYGEGGPQSSLPGFDPVLQAASGMMTAQGGDDEPVFYTIAINDVAGAVLSTFGITAALVHRQHTGKGQRIWTSLVGASAIMQSGELTRFEGREPPPVGGRDFAGREPLRRFYAVADGWIRVDADAGQVDPTALTGAGLTGFTTLGPSASAAELDAALARAVANLSRDEAAERLYQARVPAAAARHTNELLTDDRMVEAQVVHYHRRSDGRPYTTAGRFAAFSRTQRTDVLEPPGLGEHSTEVLREAGLPASEVDSLLEGEVVVQGGPMDVQLMVNYR